ncbi:MAG TPA: cytochrome P460 family protein [Kofleriaceae bacterium]
MRSTLLLITLLGACGSDPDPGAPSELPADYLASYTQVRDCRLSIDHDLNFIRVLAAPDALDVYNSRTGAFPVGAVVVKEQFGEDDDTCSGTPIRWTVMKKLDGSETPDDLGWTWQQLGKKMKVDSDADIERCTSCHADCGKAPDGYDGTCTMP